MVIGRKKEEENGFEILLFFLFQFWFSHDYLDIKLPPFLESHAVAGGDLLKYSILIRFIFVKLKVSRESHGEILCNNGVHGIIWVNRLRVRLSNAAILFPSSWPEYLAWTFIQYDFDSDIESDIVVLLI